ncbi:UNVERIFIED_CONTAM: hypothetical protein K2H54_001989, partial [Gekko kuhli]
MSMRDDSDEFFSDNETGESLIAAHRAHGVSEIMAPTPTPTASASALARKGSSVKKRPHSPIAEHDAGAILSTLPKRSALQVQADGSGETGSPLLSHDISHDLSDPEPLNDTGDRANTDAGNTQLASKPDSRGNVLLSPEVMRFFKNM